MKFKKVRKRFLSVLLVLTMLAGMIPLSAISTFAATVSNDNEVGALGAHVTGLLYRNSSYASNFNSVCTNGNYQFVIISTSLGNTEFDRAYNLAKQNGKKV